MPSSLSTSTAGNIRAEMARRGFTQSSLAPLVGMQQPSLSARLRGSVPIDLDELVRIADALGVTTSWLLRDEPAETVAS